MQIAVELLIGRKVRDSDGKSVGRIEEFRVDRQHNALLVEDYLARTPREDDADPTAPAAAGGSL